MDYLDGGRVNVGDEVGLGGGMSGYVVCDFESRRCVKNFPFADWAKFEKGVLVRSKEAGFIYFAEPYIDLVFMRSAIDDELG